MKLLRRPSSRKAKRSDTVKDEKGPLSPPSILNRIPSNQDPDQSSDGQLPMPTPFKTENCVSRPSSSASATKALPDLPAADSQLSIPLANRPTTPRNLAPPATGVDASSRSPSNSHLSSAPYSRAASTSSENWTGPEDADGSYVRKTYAHFDASGIKGDGLVDGKEWTRERGARSAWDASESASHPVTRMSAANGDQEAGTIPLVGDSVGLTSSPRAKGSPSSSVLLEVLESPIENRRDLSPPNRAMGDGSFGASSSSLGGNSTDSINAASSREQTPGVVVPQDNEMEAERQEMMKNIDRYGFFNNKDEQSGQSSRSRITVLPASSLQSIPKRRGGTRQGLRIRGEGRHSGGMVSSPKLTSDEYAINNSDDAPEVTKSLQSVLESRESKESTMREREAIRVAKWDRMLEVRTMNHGSSCYGLLPNIIKSKKFRRRVYKGVPDRWRSAAWWAILLEHSARLGEAEQDYKRLLTTPSPHDVQIDLDVPRTISGHVLFHTRYGQGQRSLFHVLHAFSLHCPDCAYCQGMGPIVATLLVYFTPEKSYAIMLELHRRSFYGLHQTFSPGFPGLVENFYVQRKLCERLCPELVASLESDGVAISSYATKWYITLYTNVLPFSTQLRLWDCYLLQGKDLLVVIAVAILWSLREQLMQGGFEVAMKSLTREFVPIDDDTFLNWIYQVIEREDNRKILREARHEYRRLTKEGKEPML